MANIWAEVHVLYDVVEALTKDTVIAKFKVDSHALKYAEGLNEINNPNFIVVKYTYGQIYTLPEAS